jgi:hypothetical protein
LRGDRGRSVPRLPGPLTRRERAAGGGGADRAGPVHPEIARRLHQSPRTIGHHMAYVPDVLAARCTPHPATDPGEHRRTPEPAGPAA